MSYRHNYNSAKDTCKCYKDSLINRVKTHFQLCSTLSISESLAHFPIVSETLSISESLTQLQDTYMNREKTHIQSWQIHIFNRGKDTFLNLNSEKHICVHPAPLHQKKPIAHYALLCNVFGRWRVAEGLIWLGRGSMRNFEILVASM